MRRRARVELVVRRAARLAGLPDDVDKSPLILRSLLGLRWGVKAERDQLRNGLAEPLRIAQSARTSSAGK
jgi:hypothetical protein